MISDIVDVQIRLYGIIMYFSDEFDIIETDKL